MAMNSDQSAGQPTCYVCGEPFVLTKDSGDFIMETIMTTHAERDAVWTDVYRHVACGSEPK